MKVYWSEVGADTFECRLPDAVITVQSVPPRIEWRVECRMQGHPYAWSGSPSVSFTSAKRRALTWVKQRRTEGTIEPL